MYKYTIEVRNFRGKQDGMFRRYEVMASDLEEAKRNARAAMADEYSIPYTGVYFHAQIGKKKKVR